jgi:uncharacterized coiled-coil protein SlyX
MSSEDFEQRFQHHVEFMLEQQARFDERLGKLERTQAQQAENINRLVGTVESVVNEMRDGFNNLIVANEVTRDLAEKATALAIQTSHRVTQLEQKPS